MPNCDEIYWDFVGAALPETLNAKNENTRRVSPGVYRESQALKTE